MAINLIEPISPWAWVRTVRLQTATKPGEPQGEGAAAKDAGETRSHFVRDWIIDRLRAKSYWPKGAA